MPMTRKEFLEAAARSTAAVGAWPYVPIVEAAATQSVPSARPAAKTAAPPSGVTAAVVGFIATASIRDVPEKVVHEAKRCLIDGFGVVLAGATVRGSAIIRETIKAAAGSAEATVLGPDRLQAPAASAALANGASGHAMDYDDTQLSSSPDRVFGLLTHPTVPALAASLAVGEGLGISGAQFLEAFL
ncbi:MAG: MmgE/PrpD family protein, partial [Acidobacteria bacterium]|nr:MmgE/PrpD family protein [Acidobacteriota bacterium]